MSTQPFGQEPRSSRKRSWRDPTTPQVIAAAVSGAALLICGIGVFSSIDEQADPVPQIEVTTGVATPADESSSEIETTAAPTARLTTAPPTTAPTSTAPTAEATTTNAAKETETDAEVDADVRYENCDAARDAGAAPVYEDEAGYHSDLDRDGDGVGCEGSSGGGSGGDSGGGGNDDEGDGGGDVDYANCSEAEAAGAAPLYRGEPGYRDGLDRDDDGVACDQ